MEEFGSLLDALWEDRGEFPEELNRQQLERAQEGMRLARTFVDAWTADSARYLSS